MKWLGVVALRHMRGRGHRARHAVRLLAALLCVSLAQAAGPAEAASIEFADPVGDAPAALADITRVVVADDDDGRLRFKVDLPNRPNGLEPADVLYVLLDVDLNVATGNQGFDYLVRYADRRAMLGRYMTGVSQPDFNVPQGRLEVINFVGGPSPGPVIWVGRDEITRPTAFRFAVLTWRLDSGPSTFDAAPSTGLWAFGTPPTTPPLPPLPPLTAARSVADAPNLKSSVRYAGSSMKHTAVGNLIYRTLKRFVQPRLLAFACWSTTDWEPVLDSAGIETHAGSAVQGFWLRRQPRWLHLSPTVCRDVQGLLDDGGASGRRAASLSTVIHEALHGYGLSNEAQVNCFAVQLVPYVAEAMELPRKRASYLGDLAVRKTRQLAPTEYWSRTNCRDGGRWDLFPKVRNL